MSNELIFEHELKPAVITADFEGMRARLDELLKPYEGFTPADAEKIDIKTAKSCRAELNAMSRQLNDARKEIKRVYELPLKEFEGQIKELDELIQAPAQMLGDAIKSKEAAEKEARREKLEQTYIEFAPALAEVVDFDRILESQWLNKSYGEKKAENAMCDKVAAVAKDWRALKDTDLRVPEATEAEFFRTLSLQDALAYDKREAEEQDRIGKMKEEIESYQPKPEPKPEPEPTPEPAQNTQETAFYFLMIEANESQFATVKSVLSAAEIHGRMIKAPKDKVSAVYEKIKEALNE